MARNETYDSDIETWNSNLSMAMLPNTLFLVFYLLTGILGNGITLIIYRRRMEMSNERFLVPVLAGVDLLASAFSSSFEIIQHQWQVTFQNTYICKSLWCLCAFFTLMSVSVIMIIATQRFAKICRPIGSEMTTFKTYIALSVSFVISLSLSIPPTIFFGAVDISNVELNLTGKRCGRIKEGNQTGFLIYGMLIVLTLISTMTLLIFIYSKIGHTLYTHFKNTKDPPVSSRSSKSTNEITRETSIVESMDIALDENKSKETVQEYGNIRTFPRKMDKLNLRLKHKLNLMFMVITIVFIICYVPFVILLLVEGLNNKFWEDLSDSTRNGLTFIQDLYIVNNIINPFMYAFMDTKFRVQCKKLFSCK